MRYSDSVDADPCFCDDAFHDLADAAPEMLALLLESREFVRMTAKFLDDTNAVLTAASRKAPKEDADGR